MNKIGLIFICGILFLASTALADQVLVNPLVDRIAFNVGGGPVCDINGNAGLYIKNDGNWYCITETSPGYKSICAYVLSCLNNGTSFYIAAYGTHNFNNKFPVYRIIGAQNVKYW